MVTCPVTTGAIVSVDADCHTARVEVATTTEETDGRSIFMGELIVMLVYNRVS